MVIALFKLIQIKKRVKKEEIDNGLVEFKESEQRGNYSDFMINKETLEERKLRFKAMRSCERQALLRKKMKAEGLEEGSGVKPLSFYDKEEIWDLIEITSCSPKIYASKGG